MSNGGQGSGGFGRPQGGFGMQRGFGQGMQGAQARGGQGAYGGGIQQMGRNPGSLMDYQPGQSGYIEPQPGMMYAGGNPNFDMTGGRGRGTPPGTGGYQPPPPPLQPPTNGFPGNVGPINLPPTTLSGASGRGPNTPLVSNPWMGDPTRPVQTSTLPWDMGGSVSGGGGGLIAQQPQTSGLHPHQPQNPQGPSLMQAQNPAARGMPQNVQDWDGVSAVDNLSGNGALRFTFDPSKHGKDATGMRFSSGALGSDFGLGAGMQLMDMNGNPIGQGSQGQARGLGGLDGTGMTAGQQYLLNYTGRQGATPFRISGNFR